MAVAAAIGRAAFREIACVAQTSGAIDTALPAICADSFQTLARQIAQPGIAQAVRIIHRDIAMADAPDLSAVIGQFATRILGSVMAGTSIRAGGLNNDGNGSRAQKKLDERIIRSLCRGRRQADCAQRDTSSQKRTIGTQSQGT